MARLGSKIEQSEELAKRETRQLKETTDKSMKEVTRTLATLVEQHRSKVGENVTKLMCVCGGILVVDLSLSCNVMKILILISIV